MAIMIDREGDFQCRVLEVQVKGFAKSKSVAFSIHAQILSVWDAATEAWQSWEGYEPIEVYTDLFIIKKDGTPNHRQVADIAAALQWDGDFTAIVGRNNSGWPNFQVQVKSDTYDGNTRYRGTWITPFGAPVGVGGGMDEAGLAKLAAQYGSGLRAIASTAQPPAQRPAQPPTQAPARPPAQAPQPQQSQPPAQPPQSLADFEQAAAGGAEPNYPPSMDN